MKIIVAFLMLATVAPGQLQFGQNASSPTLNNRWLPAESRCADLSGGYSAQNDNAGATFGAVDFTVAVWLYVPAKVAANPYFFGKDASGSGYALGYINSSGQNGWWMVIRNTGAWSQTTPIITGAWTLVIGKQVAASAKIYLSVNGGPFNAGAAWAGGTNTTAGAKVSMGGGVAGYGCKAGIWSRAFSNADAAALYNNGNGFLYKQLPASLSSNLVAYWDLSARDGDTDPTVPVFTGQYEATNLTSTGAFVVNMAASSGKGVGFGQPQSPVKYNLVWEGDSQTDPNGHGTSWAQWMIPMMGPLSRNFGYKNYAVSGTTIAQMTARAPSVTSAYNANYAANVLLVYAGTNDSGGANMIGAEAALASYISARHSEGWKVVILTVVPTTAAGYWTGTNRAAYNTWMCPSVTAGICSGGSSGADLVVDVGNNAALQNPSDGINYYADHLHFTTAGKYVVAQQMVPAVRAWLGL